MIRTRHVMLLKQFALGILRSVLPLRIYWRILAWKIGYLETEMRLLPYLCKRDLVSIDIGASGGSYTAHLLTMSRKCYAFEPIPEAAKALRRKLGASKCGSLLVEAVALSDRSGEGSLTIPMDNLGRSTLEIANPLGNASLARKVVVPVRRLDEYDWNERVGFIKIDVEGHEEAVLRGSVETLHRDRPSLLIEVEERHNKGSISRVTCFLRDRGYRGHFYRDGKLKPIESLDAKRDQSEQDLHSNESGRRRYINNFIFIPEEHMGAIVNYVESGAPAG